MVIEDAQHRSSLKAHRRPALPWRCSPRPAPSWYRPSLVLRRTARSSWLCSSTSSWWTSTGSAGGQRAKLGGERGREDHHGGARFGGSLRSPRPDVLSAPTHAVGGARDQALCPPGTGRVCLFQQRCARLCGPERQAAARAAGAVKRVRPSSRKIQPL